MLIIALTLAVAAVGCWTMNPARTRYRVFLTDTMMAPRAHNRARLMAGSAVVVGLVLAWAMGATSGVITTAALVTGGTVGYIGRRRWLGIGAGKRRKQVADGCAALAAEVAAGRVPAQALLSVAEDFPVLALGAGVARVGGDPVDMWHKQAKLPGLAGLAVLGQAWQVSTTTGAPMAGVLACVAELLRSDKALAATVNSELAAPRATGRLLAILPLFGIGIGYAMGGNPIEFLTGHIIGQCSLILGVLFACAGLLWIEHIAEQATAW